MKVINAANFCRLFEFIILLSKDLEAVLTAVLEQLILQPSSYTGPLKLELQILHYSLISHSACMFLKRN